MVRATSLPSFPTIQRDLCYQPAHGLSLNLHRPTGRKACPVVLYVHGGGWKSGDKEDAAQVEALLAAGFAVATLTYRLAPAAAFPAPIEDVKAAVRWLRARGNAHGLATKKIGAWGHSAGAHLVALAATTNGRALFDTGENLDFSSRVDAACCVAGFFDFPALGRSRAAGPEDDLLGTDAVTREARAYVASPATHLRPDAPPFLLIHGEDDAIAPPEQSRAFHAALRAAGARSRLVLQPGVDHRNWDHPQAAAEMTAFFHATIRP